MQSRSELGCSRIGSGSPTRTQSGHTIKEVGGRCRHSSSAASRCCRTSLDSARVNACARCISRRSRPVVPLIGSESSDILLTLLGPDKLRDVPKSQRGEQRPPALSVVVRLSERGHSLIDRTNVFPVGLTGLLAERGLSCLEFVESLSGPHGRLRNPSIAGGFIDLGDRFDFPDPESFEQATTYRLPVDGKWTVVNGGHEKESSHSWGILTQRYAYDFVKTDDEGRTHTGDGSERSDYYCWEEPVLAPADGVVVAANDGHRDAPRTGSWLDLKQRDIRGNYIVLKHTDEEYSVLAHLRRGVLQSTKAIVSLLGSRLGSVATPETRRSHTTISTYRTRRRSIVGWDSQ